MNKQELIQRIQKAKSSHIKWRSYAQAIVAGIKVSEDKAPVQHTDCEFGRWYYGDGRSTLGQMPVFNDIEGPHEVMHATYRQIFELATKGKLDKAREQMVHLCAISKSLVELLDILEEQVNTASE